MTLDTIYLGIDKGSRNPNVTLLARCGYMVVHLGESMMRIHDSLAGSKCQLSNEYRNNFFFGRALRIQAVVESFKGGFCPWENLFLLIYLPPFTPPE